MEVDCSRLNISRGATRYPDVLKLATNYVHGSIPPQDDLSLAGKALHRVYVHACMLLCHFWTSPCVLSASVLGLRKPPEPISSAGCTTYPRILLWLEMHLLFFPAIIKKTNSPTVSPSDVNRLCLALNLTITGSFYTASGYSINQHLNYFRWRLFNRGI